MELLFVSLLLTGPTMCMGHFFSYPYYVYQASFEMSGGTW